MIYYGILKYMGMTEEEMSNNYFSNERNDMTSSQSPKYRYLLIHPNI